MANIITRKMQERQVKRSGFGPTESGSHWSDPKPYVDWYDNGLFIGYNPDETWLYFRFPEDVRTEWLEDPKEALRNQSDFTKVVAAFGVELDAQRERMKKDKRREFHIQITQSRFKGIIPPADATPEMKDYLYRMSLGDSYREMMSLANEQKLETRYSKPIWNGYIGIKLHNKGIFSNQHGFSQRMERYKDFLFGRVSEEYLRMESYTADIQDVRRIMTQNGFREITPATFDNDFRNLTAWYGIEDKTFAVPQELQNARMREPKHGLSLITPNWGEIAFHSLIADRDSPADRDPLGGSSSWGSKMFSPGSNVVAISIRGQIRSPKIFENVIRQQMDRVKNSGDKKLMAAVQSRMKETSQVAPIDNAEIVVASKIRSGKVPEVDRIAKSSQMSLRPLVDRQPDGLFHTLPTYPKRINPVPTTNKRRPELTNAMLPGIISMSGIFQSTKPCASSGYLMGLSVRGFEFKEIYTGLDAAKEKSGSPSILISGAPGSGKTQQMMQLAHQANRWGQKQYFFNPKSVGTLADSFNGMRNSVVIRIDHAFLQNNPGLLDVTYYIEDGVTCANILGEAIFKSRHMEGDADTDLRTMLKAEIKKRALNPNNNSAHDIIFGNGLTGEKATQEIPHAETVRFLKQKIETSAFWKAFLDSGRGSGVIRERINTAEAILFEWEEGLDLPTSGDKASDEQLDNLLSVTTLFQYAVTDLVASGGGLLQIDESSVLKQSEEARSRLVKGGREWRQAGITLIMGTQNISDWLDTGDENTGNAKDALDSYFARYLIMSINPKAKHEIDAYYQIAALERTEQHTRFITHAGTTHQRIPFAYYVDNLYQWEGPILCGPWPDRELNLGRTDKDGEREREAKLRKNMATRKLDEGALQDESFGGELRIAVATLQGEAATEGAEQ